MKKLLISIILLLSIALIWTNWSRIFPPSTTPESRATRGSGESVDYDSPNLRSPLKDSAEVQERISAFEERLKDTVGVKFTTAFFRQTGTGKIPSEMRKLLKEEKLTKAEMIDSVYWACLAHFGRDNLLKESATVPETGLVITTISRKDGTAVNESFQETAFSLSQRLNAAALAEAILKMPDGTIRSLKTPMGM